MKRFITATALALFLSLGACATVDNPTPKQKAEAVIQTIDLAYYPAQFAAQACISGMICSDAAVREIVAKVMPLLNEAYTSGVAFILANADSDTAMVARKKIIMDAITLVVKTLATFGVKV